MAQIFNLHAGTAAKHAGMNAVQTTARQWYIGAKATVITWLQGCVGQEVTGEDVTAYVIGQLGDPNKPQIFGSLIHALMREGWLELTGKRVPMAKVDSHARKTDVYLVKAA